MKLIDFTNGSKNLFHLLQFADLLSVQGGGCERRIERMKNPKTPKEKEFLEAEKKELASIHNAMQYLSDNNSSIRLTGLCREIEVGDLVYDLNFPRHENSNIKNIGVLQVKQVIKRDHKGVFRNPEDAKGSFFDAACVTYPMQLEEFENLTNKKAIAA